MESTCRAKCSPSLVMRRLAAETFGRFSKRTFAGCAYCGGRNGFRRLACPQKILISANIWPLYCHCRASRPCIRAHIPHGRLARAPAPAQKLATRIVQTFHPPGHRRFSMALLSQSRAAYRNSERRDDCNSRNPHSEVSLYSGLPLTFWL